MALQVLFNFLPRTSKWQLWWSCAWNIESTWSTLNFNQFTSCPVPGSNLQSLDPKSGVISIQPWWSHIKGEQNLFNLTQQRKEVFVGLIASKMWALSGPEDPGFSWAKLRVSVWPLYGQKGGMEARLFMGWIKIPLWALCEPKEGHGNTGLSWARLKALVWVLSEFCLGCTSPGLLWARLKVYVWAMRGQNVGRRSPG